MMNNRTARLAIFGLAWSATSVTPARPLSGQEPADSTNRPAAEATTPEQSFFDWTTLQFPAEEYGARRAALISALEQQEGVVLVLSGHGLSHGDTFRQNDDFLYLTGLELPGSALVLDVASGLAIAFVPERDFRFENRGRPNDFPGRPLAADAELTTTAGLDQVRPFSQLDAAFAEWERRGTRVHLNAGRRGQIRRVVTSLIPDWDPALLSLYHVQTSYPDLELVNAYGAMARVRMVHTELEIAAMRRAADATQAAIRVAAARVRDGITERQLTGTFEASCREEGAARIPFTPIIKSGPNSLWPWRVLASHYDRRNRAMRDGDLVIFDVGCEIDYYVSDIGRTLPVSGTFTAEQRQILEMEVAVADAIIAAVRPGVTLAELQAVADAAIPPEHRRFMQTGLFFGHHIGLSTGDPNLSEAPLAPGMIFTVEPWYYNHVVGISVFTEDVILVTEDGAEILSSDLPRDPEGLERLVGG